MHCRSFVFVVSLLLSVSVVVLWLCSLITLWLKFVPCSFHRHRHVSCARWVTLFDFSVHFTSYLFISFIFLHFLLPFTFYFPDVVENNHAHFRWGVGSPGQKELLHSKGSVRACLPVRVKLQRTWAVEPTSAKDPCAKTAQHKDHHQHHHHITTTIRSHFGSSWAKAATFVAFSLSVWVLDDMAARKRCGNSTSQASQQLTATSGGTTTIFLWKRSSTSRSKLGRASCRLFWVGGVGVIRHIKQVERALSSLDMDAPALEAAGKLPEQQLTELKTQQKAQQPLSKRLESARGALQRAQRRAEEAKVAFTLPRLSKSRRTRKQREYSPNSAHSNKRLTKQLRKPQAHAHSTAAQTS